jgi:hypothetical protein
VQDLSRKSDAYVGKCKSNFVGTEFTLWDSGSNPKGLKDGEEVPPVFVCVSVCVCVAPCAEYVGRV